MVPAAFPFFIFFFFPYPVQMFCLPSFFRDPAPPLTSQYRPLEGNPTNNEGLPRMNRSTSQSSTTASDSPSSVLASPLPETDVPLSLPFTSLVFTKFSFLFIGLRKISPTFCWRQQLTRCSSEWKKTSSEWKNTMVIDCCWENSSTRVHRKIVVLLLPKVVGSLF